MATWVHPATGEVFDHTHPGAGSTAGCPACKARNRELRVRTYRQQHGIALDAPRYTHARPADIEKLRATNRRGSAKYRALHGRPHDHRYPGVTTLREDWLRRGIDPDVCFYCPAPAEHADHYFPRARGGSDDFKNLVPACAPCNHRKRDRLPIEWQAVRLANYRRPAAHRQLVGGQPQGDSRG
ncbi:HNH endonuclease [Microbacterium phage Nicky22]|nr:HNH endonuclease [Microbacterium phage Nicky22]